MSKAANRFSAAWSVGFGVGLGLGFGFEFEMEENGSDIRENGSRFIGIG